MSRSKSSRFIFNSTLQKRLQETFFIITNAIAIFLLIAFISYNIDDPAWSHTGSNAEVMNLIGPVGAYLADFLFFLLGYFAYIIPISLIILSIRLIFYNLEFNLNIVTIVIKLISSIFFILSSCGLLSILFNLSDLNYGYGGVIGNSIANYSNYYLNKLGTIILFFTILITSASILLGFSWLSFFEIVGKNILFAIKYTYNLIYNLIKGLLLKIKNQNFNFKFKQKIEQKIEKITPIIKNIKPKIIVENKKIEPIINNINVSEPVINDIANIQIKKPDNSETNTPSLELLNTDKSQKIIINPDDLEKTSREVEQKLLDFGVIAQVVAVQPGPVITRFELELAPGLKASKITGLAKDIARSLSIPSVRVVEIIPEKSVVGLELPNEDRQIVLLHEVLASKQYQDSRSPLILSLGVDISGNPMMVDLAKMPHLLVAGTTGSGKSVGINAMILSLLYKSTPDIVRLILIDPKMLELSVYADIPHLLTPVVTDMEEASGALRWAVGEMERRYKLMAALGVRNITGFNNKIKEANDENPILDPLWKGDTSTETAPVLEHLPFIVIIIDELADMMMVVGKKVEQLIARIAQKARAAGIHLILATQRPSVDVLTGLIKSNIPTRISFQVSSKIDSRTILDQQGAENLLGHGDMLYLSPGSGSPIRVHGAFVDDNEVHGVANDWKQRGEPNYITEITDGSFLEELTNSDSSDLEDSDPLYDEAVAFVIESRKASISSIQRKLKIGYNRAARMVEEMERTGLVGPLENGTRTIKIPEKY